MARRQFQMSPVHKSRGKQKHWCIRYRVNMRVGIDPNTGNVLYARRPKYRQLGECKDMTKRDAERIRTQFMETINRAEYVIQSQIPFEEFVEAWKRAHLPKVQVAAQQNYVSKIDRHILPHFQGKRLCDIDRQAVEMWLNQIQHLAWRTRATIRGLLKQLFNTAIDWGYWEKVNPVHGTRIGERTGGFEKEPLTVAQFRVLLAALEEPLRAMAELAVTTGMRVSEMLRLTWDRVKHGKVLVRGKVKRERSRRDLPLGHLELVRPFGAKDTDRVFTVPPYWKLQEKLRAAAERVGVYRPGFGWHTFRHTHCTLFDAQVAPETQDQMGHATAGMTAHYRHQSWERKEGAVRRMQEAVVGETEGGREQ